MRSDYGLVQQAFDLIKPMSDGGVLPADGTETGDPSGPQSLAAPLLLILAHIPLALLMKGVPALAGLHAVLILMLGCYWGLRGSVIRVALLGAYITSSEVVWRMCQAPVFWEFGKLTLCLVFVITLIRSGSSRPPLMPMAYFALLLPSSLLVIQNPDSQQLRSDLSFNLSGPLSLMVAAWFYSRLELTRQQVMKLFLVFLAPIAGISTIALYSMMTRSKIIFNGESNFATSGGFGPNQVSALLGLGSLIAMLYYLIRARRGLLGIISLAVVMLLATQSALTFSRTGVYCAGAGILAASFLMARDFQTRWKFTLSTVLLGSVACFVIVPFLDAYTEGHFLKRYSESGYSGRDTLMWKDLSVFLENPVLGIGPGSSKAYHMLGRHGGIASHSEFTRLVAEHGCLGLMSLLLVGLSAIGNFRRQKTDMGRSVSAALIVWSLLILFSNAMRCVAPSFTFGLCFSMMIPDEG